MILRMIGVVFFLLIIAAALTGCFETTEERTVRLGSGINESVLDGRDLDSPTQRCRNFGRSVDNVCLDGDGVN